MKILALDTSSNACSVALLINNKIDCLHKIAPIAQAQLVLPMIEELLKNAKIQLQDLDAIAFGCGPGSFTGARIAASVAQGLAFGAQIPLIKISSLAAMAQQAYQDHGWNRLLVAIDARMHEVYFGAYQIDNNHLAKLCNEEKVCAPDLIPLQEKQEYCGVGDAWGIYAEQMNSRLGFKPIDCDIACLPNASTILELAKQKFLNKAFCPIEEAVPVYLRDNVAVKEKDRPSNNG